MGVIKFLRDISGLFNWNTDDNPTSEQDYMNAVKNWQETEKNLVDTVLWQPTTAYSVGDIVKTPSLSSPKCLVCTTAGTSGAYEPDYTTVDIDDTVIEKGAGSTVSDGSVVWTINRVLVGYSYYAKNTETHSLTASTAKTILQTGSPLPAGTWIVTGHLQFADIDSTKRYGCMLTPTNNSFNSANDSSLYIAGAVSLQTTKIFTLSSPTTIYLTAYTTATGSSVSSGTEINAYKLC